MLEKGPLVHNQEVILRLDLEAAILSQAEERQEPDLLRPPWCYKDGSESLLLKGQGQEKINSPTPQRRRLPPSNSVSLASLLQKNLYFKLMWFVKTSMSGIPSSQKGVVGI